MKRRPIYLSAGLLVCVSTASLSVFNLIVPNLDASLLDQISFIPLLLVVMMYTGFGIGYGPIVFLMQGKCWILIGWYSTKLISDWSFHNLQYNQQNSFQENFFQVTWEVLVVGSWESLTTFLCSSASKLFRFSSTILVLAEPSWCIPSVASSTSSSASLSCQVNLFLLLIQKRLKNLFLTETKGLSLEEIEEFYRKWENRNTMSTVYLKDYLNMSLYQQNQIPWPDPLVSFRVYPSHPTLPQLQWVVCRCWVILSWLLRAVELFPPDQECECCSCCWLIAELWINVFLHKVQWQYDLVNACLGYNITLQGAMYLCYCHGKHQLVQVSTL